MVSPPNITNYGVYQGVPSLPISNQSQPSNPQSGNTTYNYYMGGNSGSNLGSDISQAGKIGGQIIKSFNSPSVWDSAGNFVGKSTVDGVGGAGSAISNVLGKVAPIAGAAMGTYGLIKGGSTGSNLLNGAESGASIGSMIAPGIGTLAGAGIGALVGGIRSLFHGPSQEELQGRQTQGQAIQSIDQYATPDQIKEAQGAVGHGWDNSNDPLAMIVMRDQLQKSLAGPNGRTAQTDAQAESMAEQYMKGLWGAEKDGTQSVAQAYSPIQSLMSGYNPHSSFTPIMANTTYGG